MYSSNTLKCDKATSFSLSPQAADFPAQATEQSANVTALSPHAATFIVAPPNEVIKHSGLSPRAPPFVAMPTSPTNATPALSPHAANCVPEPTYQTPLKSKLSAHAETFAATPAVKTPDNDNVENLHADVPTKGEALLLSLDPAVRELLTDGAEWIRGWIAMKRCITALGLCQTALGAQLAAIKHQKEECNGHCVAFFKWKRFERYDEPCTEEDIENIKTSAEAQEFRCTKCGDTLPNMQHEFEVTKNAYLQLVDEHDRALDEYVELTSGYNASVDRYYEHISGRESPVAES